MLKFLPKKVFKPSKQTTAEGLVATALLDSFSEAFIKGLQQQGCKPEHLIEAAARERMLEPSSLLAKTAKYLKLEAATQLQTPDDQILAHWVLSPQRMREIGILPGPTSKVPQLICSNPDKIALKQFKKAGIKIYLALGSEIIRTWEDFHKGKIVSDEKKLDFRNDDRFKILLQLAQDCQKIGANEVHLGYPESSLYQFQYDGKVYQGPIHPEVVNLATSLGYREGGYSFDTSEMKLQLSFPSDLVPRRLCLNFQTNAPKPTSPQLSSNSISNSSFSKTISPSLQNSVLLIDDDPRFLKILANIMRQKGWQVNTCKDGHIALKTVLSQDRCPKLIVCDVHMPSPNGKEILRSLRTNKIDIPVVMLSGDNDRLLEAELALLGADIFTRKQDDPRILLSWCQSLIDRRFNNQEE